VFISILWCFGFVSKFEMIGRRYCCLNMFKNIVLVERVICARENSGEPW